MLYKYYPAGEGYANDADTLTAFINAHLTHSDLGFGQDLAGDPGFVLITESVTPLSVLDVVS